MSESVLPPTEQSAAPKLALVAGPSPWPDALYVCVHREEAGAIQDAGFACAEADKPAALKRAVLEAAARHAPVCFVQHAHEELVRYVRECAPDVELWRVVLPPTFSNACQYLSWLPGTMQREWTSVQKEVAHGLWLNLLEGTDEQDQRNVHSLDLVFREPEEAEKPAGPTTPTAAIERAWTYLAPGSLSVAPKARAWLLQHPTADGKPAAPGCGDGWIPLGKVCGLLAEGGVGKTVALLQMAVALITGVKLFGHFEVAREVCGRKVALILAEEDMEEVHRRLFNVARALGLDEADRRLVEQSLALVPLAGIACSLLRLEGGAFARPEMREVEALQRQLAQHAGPTGWSMVALDPLARLSAGLAESKDGAGTLLVQLAELLTQAPGNPTVIVSHHSSKSSRQQGGVDARGRTELTDAMRLVVTLKQSGKRVLLEQGKSNYSRPWTEAVELARNEGILRVVDGDEAEAEAKRLAELQQRKALERCEQLVGRVVDLAKTIASPMAREGLAEALGGRLQHARLAVDMAAERGLLVNVGSEAAPRYWPAELPPPVRPQDGSRNATKDQIRKSFQAVGQDGFGSMQARDVTGKSAATVSEALAGMVEAGELEPFDRDGRRRWRFK